MARKLGFRNELSKEYAEWVADVKENFITNQHLEIIEGPKALKDKGLEKVWNSVVAIFVTEQPRFDRTRFSDKRQIADAANKLLKGQVKKIRLCPSATRVKRAGDIPNNRLQIGQSVVPLDLSVVLSSDSSCSCFVSTYSLLLHIYDLQDWVRTKLRFVVGSVKMEVVFPVKDEQYFLTFRMTSSGTVCLDVSDQAS